MKSRYMQGLGWEIRADVPEHNTGNMPMDLLVQYAQRRVTSVVDVTRSNRPKRPDGPRPVESAEPPGRHHASMSPRR